MKFYVVVPCLEHSASLQRTLDSIRAQSVLRDATHAVHCVVQVKDDVPRDGFEFESHENISIEVRFAADHGLYDALTRAFAGAEADVYCYLGSGDYLSPHALEIVGEAIQTGADWVTGFICGYNDRGHLVEVRIPFRFRQRLIRRGVYGRWLPYIQQESTFWTADLHRLIDWQSVAGLRLAGDADIWRQLAAHSELVAVEAWLGGFEKRPGQLSELNRDEYQRELRSISAPLSLLDRVTVIFDWLIWHCPRSVKRALDPNRITYSPAGQHYVRANSSPRSS